MKILLLVHTFKTNKIRIWNILNGDYNIFIFRRRLVLNKFVRNENMLIYTDNSFLLIYGF
jgi:hypothetical protein